MIVKVLGHTVATTKCDVTLNYDSVSDVFSCSLPFDNRSEWAPLRYLPIEIYDGKRKLMTGTIINHRFKSNANANELAISGYSVTGILDDCPNIQQELADPVADESTGSQSSCFSGISLFELAKKLIAPFNISVTYDPLVAAKVNEAYEQCTTTPEESIASYLGKLATLKNVVLRSTMDGQITFTQIDENAKPVASFISGRDNNIEMDLEVNGQQMHNKIYVSGRADLYGDENQDKSFTGEKDFIQNPLVKDVNRATLKVQGTEVKLIKDVSKAVLADELKNIVVTINIQGLKLAREKTKNAETSETTIVYNELKPGDLVNILAPDIYINHMTKFMIRQINHKEDAKERTMSIACVLPQTMTGNTPDLIFD